jgi:hypothetical protein
MLHFVGHALHCASWCLIWHLADAYYGLTSTIFKLLGLGF